MSIQSEIDRINSNVQAALNAVADTGVSVPEGANSDNLPAAVSALANEKQDKLTFDATPTANSTNPVTSGGVKTELDKKASTTSLGAHTGNTDNPHQVTAAQAGAIPSTEKGAASGVATLGADGKVPSAQLPSMNYAPLSHSQNNTIHVTAEEKAMWNAKGKGNAIIYTGSYVGTGTYGSSNPTAITIPESSGMTNLKFIYVYQDNFWTMISKNQLYAASYYRSGDDVSLIAYQIKSSMSGRTVTFFHSAQAIRQLNKSRKTYNFFAFGE